MKTILLSLFAALFILTACETVSFVEYDTIRPGGPAVESDGPGPGRGGDDTGH